MTPLSGIITKGLGLDACHGMIYNYFHLSLKTTIVIIEPPIGAGGTPYAPGEFSNFILNQPELQYFDPTKHVIIKITLEDKKISKHFVVSRNTGYIVRNSIKIATSLSNKIKVTINSIATNKMVAPTISNVQIIFNAIKVKVLGIKNDK